MTNFNSIHIPGRALAHRTNDGLDVTLFWRPADDELTVCVCDWGRRAYFEIHPDPRFALDVFHHPYSYVSSSVVHYEDERLAV